MLYTLPSYKPCQEQMRRVPISLLIILYQNAANIDPFKLATELLTKWNVVCEFKHVIGLITILTEAPHLLRFRAKFSTFSNLGLFQQFLFMMPLSVMH